MCVSLVLYLHYYQCSMTCKLVLYCMHVCLHYCQCSVLCVWVLYCVCTTASIVCCVCKSCVLFALLPVQSVVHVSPVLRLHYCQRSKSYVVLALLPAQCAVSVSPVLCLHYCQHSVLCMQVLCCVCSMYCQGSFPCRGYDNSSYYFYFAIFYYFYPFPLVGSRWVRGPQS